MIETGDNLIYLPVRVDAGAAGSEADDMAKINKQAIEPLKSEDVFRYSGVCSNDNMDSYFTRMDPQTTLQNYVQDLQSGVALLEGHDHDKNPYGRSFDAQMIGDGQVNSVRGYWYLIRGLQMNGGSTDSFIKAITGGIIRDMSVGFGGPDIDYVCSADGKSLWDSPFMPGDLDPDGKRVFYWIKNARLIEVSTVFKGSTPGAYIDKAQDMVSQGELEPSRIATLERRYQVRLDDGKRRFYFNQPKGSERTVDVLSELRKAIEENKIEKARAYAVLDGTGEKFRQPDDIALRNELGDNATVEGIKALNKEAEQGRAYVADLIDQAVASRVRSQGQDFKADSYKQMLVRSADIEFIKDEIRSYEELVKKNLKGGRSTQGVDPQHRGDDDDPDVIVSENFKEDDE
ncbi:hypothetical protein NOM01_11050 [Sporolactobacillus sp. STSJ-5]|uniref:hypothetical protein n=1 Tax=Sporolactobacillus sp. STSJ-5 TaxID=2965076 RepID=UPI002103E1EF|nr:hypothetical protein [Sporolactobacillus sp. STSJ-5]MCQ2010553.1 hypothetical protein [Sporolactobacillus sp. STSJ-5]